jgi:hypothetical protein
MKGLIIKIHIKDQHLLMIKRLSQEKDLILKNQIKLVRKLLNIILVVTMDIEGKSQLLMKK